MPFDVFVLPLALWGWKESLAGMVARVRAWRAARGGVATGAAEPGADAEVTPGPGGERT